MSYSERIQSSTDLTRLRLRSTQTYGKSAKTDRRSSDYVIELLH
jgi:hypothetical protein